MYQPIALEKKNERNLKSKTTLIYAQLRLSTSNFKSRIRDVRCIHGRCVYRSDAIHAIIDIHSVVPRIDDAVSEVDEDDKLEFLEMTTNPQFKERVPTRWSKPSAIPE